MQRKFIILTEKGVAQCQEEPWNEAAEPLRFNEAVIQTSMSLISAGTELSRVFAIKQGFTYPVYPGYSAIGTVIEKGPGLPGIEAGDRVFYSGVHASVNRFLHEGTTQGGKIMKIDPRLSDRQACLIPLGLIAMNAVTACKGNLTDTAAVYGLGTIGIMAALLLKREGLRVIGLDPVASRCEEAKKLGIEEVLSCESGDQVTQVMALTEGRGSEISVDVSGISGAIVNAIQAAAKHGQVILLGSPRASFTCDITPVLNAIHMKMLEVKGAFNELNPYPVTDGTRRSVLRDFDAVQRLILDGTFDADQLISHVIKPFEIQEAYNGLMFDRETWHCAVIDWNQE